MNSRMPVRPIRIFVPTDELKMEVERADRDDINREVYRCATNACKLASCFPALMKIHEYQAKGILARHGVPVPRGEVAFTATEVGEIARRLGGSIVVVKAQIHAGGRGKGGGVKIARSADEAESLA